MPEIIIDIASQRLTFLADNLKKLFFRFLLHLMELINKRTVGKPTSNIYLANPFHMVVFT